MCCAAECESCGGAGCSKGPREAKAMCCRSSIRQPCQDASSVACILPESEWLDARWANQQDGVKIWDTWNPSDCDRTRSEV